MSSSNILLAYGNKAPGATLAGGSWDSTLALNNLKTGKLAQVARSSSATVYNTRFRFDLGANYVLRALALVNHNLTTSAPWRLVLSQAPLDIDYTAYDDPRDERVSYSGGANRTRVNSAGLIVGKTAPRIDYGPVTLANVGLAVEGGTTNLLDTLDFDDTYWTKVALTVSAGAVAPDGTTSFRITRAADVESVITTGETIADDTAVHVQTLFVGKDATQTGLLFRLALVGGTAVTGSFFFNPVTGVVTANETPFGFNVKDWGDFWRLELAVQNNGTGNTTAALQFFMHTSGGLGYMDFFWPQLESKSFASSPVAAAATSTADVATITGSNFSGAHSATAGTLYAEFDVCTTVAGTRPIISMDNNSANERFELYASGTDLKFKVVDGGSTVVDMTIGTIAANTFYKVAVAWAANDFAASLSGAAVVTDTSGTLPTVDRMRIGANQAGDYLNGHVRRFARWLTRRTNAELQSLATTGPEALGYDTGWQNALQMTFHGDTPTNWGEQYPLIATFDATTVRYGTVEIEDTANPDGYVELGQLFVAGGFQPGEERNAEYQGFGDGRTDLSTSVKSVGGQKYSTARRRPRTVDFNFPILTQAEGDHLDEMMAEVGTTEDVLYVPDPADAAKSQRYGFLGTLRELTPLEYPFFDKRAMPLRLEQKL